MSSADKCRKCGFFSEYGYCTCRSQDKWYACPIEADKPENKKALEEYASNYGEYRGDNSYR